MSDYDVGYGKPPKTHQFQKGTSGNPRGRPRKKQDSELPEVTPILNEPVKVRSQGQEVEMSPAEVIVRKLIEQAVKDHHRPSLNKLIDDLIRYDLLPKAPEEQQGGVVYVSRSGFKEYLRQQGYSDDES